MHKGLTSETLCCTPRDVETGRLLDKWDGELTAKAPKWTKGMR